MADVTLLPCPFCGKQPERISVGTASCNGMVDGREIHNTIGMRPECWNARQPQLTREVDELREALTHLLSFDLDQYRVSGVPCKPGFKEAKSRAHKALTALQVTEERKT